MNKKHFTLPCSLNDFSKKNKFSGNNFQVDQSSPMTMLNITLERQVKAKRYPIIAELTFKRKREDIVSLLKATQKNPDKIPHRFIAYLRREQLWDSDTNSLTLKGKEVTDTGSIDIKERGLYHIWYTADDPLLGTHPLLIQRDSAFFEPRSKPWKSGADARNAGFEVSATCTVDVLEEIYKAHSQHQLTLTSLQPEVICSPEESASLSLKWRLELNKSVVFLNGKLEALDFAQKKKEKKNCDFDLKITDYQEHLNKVLMKIASQFDGHWSKSAQRMVVALENIHKYPQAIECFEVKSHSMSKLSTDFGIFDSAQIYHLPTKPIDQADAEQWHQTWLNNFHSETYQSNSDSRHRQSLWLDHEAITEFDLSMKSGQKLLDCFRRESQPKPYWHVATMVDLSPSLSKKQKLPITLMDSDVLNIRELIEQLTASDSVQHMIYSDRYVYTVKQSKNLNSIASYIEDAEGLLMTLNPPRGKNKIDLPENWERHNFDKQHDNHGRYWLFIGSSHNWCWECSSGLDFICDSDSGFIVKGTPSFTPKEVTELPRYLQNAIKTVKTAEVM